MMSACGSNRLTSFSPAKHATSGLDNNARDQRQVLRDLGTPALGCDLGCLGQPCGHRLQFVSAGLGSGDQIAIELALFGLPAAVLDGAGPLLGQAPPIAPLHRRRPRQPPPRQTAADGGYASRANLAAAKA